MIENAFNLSGKIPCMFSESHYIPQIPRLFRKPQDPVISQLS